GLPATGQETPARRRRPAPLGTRAHRSQTPSTRSPSRRSSGNWEGRVMERLFYRPKEAAAVLSMSRTAVFRLIKTGELRSVKHEGYRIHPAKPLLGICRRIEDTTPIPA